MAPDCPLWSFSTMPTGFFTGESRRAVSLSSAHCFIDVGFSIHVYTYICFTCLLLLMFDCSIFREHERYFAIAMPDSMTRCPLTRTSQLLDSTHCWATCAEKKGADSLTLTTIFMTTTRGMCTIFFTADLPKCTAIFDPFSFCTVLYWMQRQISCSGATTSHKTAASRVGDGDWLCFLGVF